MNENELKSRLESIEFPDAQLDEDRAWEVALQAHRTSLESGEIDASPGKPRVSRWWPWSLLGVLVVGVIAIAPARALVTDWVRDTVRGPDVESTVVSTAPPGGGRLLVQSPEGTWVTNDDGSRRFLGDFDDAVWSPQGRFVGAVDDRQLVALEPDGDVRWALTRPTRPYLPAWDSPDGYRIAYLEGDQLRVIAGDGTGDRELTSGIAPVRPTWYPGESRNLAFARPAGVVEVLDTETKRKVFDFTTGAPVKGLVWSSDGSTLVAWTSSNAQIRDRNGGLLWEYRARPGTSLESVQLRPERESQLAVLEQGRQSQVSLVGPKKQRTAVLAARSLTDPLWSPYGNRLMVAWPETDQWLFLNGPKLGRADALNDISDQIYPGRKLPGEFPVVEGWCCTND